MSHAQRPPMLATVSGSWWALAVRGVAAVLFGLAALIWPGLTIAVLIILYGAYALLDGVFSIVAGLRAGSGTRRWLLLAEGALGILTGLIAVFWPGVTAVVLLYIIAFWAVFGGLLRIFGAVLLRREIDNEWTMALSGTLRVLLGIVLFVLPGAGLVSLSWLIGIFALGAGITLIVLALRVHGRGPSGPSGSSTTTKTHHRTSGRPEGWRGAAKMTKVRALQGVLAVLAVLVLVGATTGCGLVSDQTKQQAKKKVESKAQQAKQEAKKEVETKKQEAKKKFEAKGQQAKQEVKKKIAAGQGDLQKKVDNLQKKVQTGQEDLKKKVDDVHKDVNDLQKKVDELLKKVDAQMQQDQKAKK